MVRCTIVNEQDEVIGYKDRAEIFPTDIYRVAALWITNSRGEILLAQRALTKRNDPGKWGPAVAGTVEEDETYDSNIVKEAQEEIGLTIEISDLKKGPKVRIAQKHQYWLQWYVYATDRPSESFYADPREVAAVRWFTRGELLSRLESDMTSFIASAVSWQDTFGKALNN